MQDYSNPVSRNTQKAIAPGVAGSAAAIPSKVSVPFPQTANMPQGGNMKGPSAPQGFDSGLKPGMV